jgi:hypothetical protein
MMGRSIKRTLSGRWEVPVHSSFFREAVHRERHGKEQTMRLYYNSPINVRPIWGMMEEPVLAAAMNFSITLLGDRMAIED